MTTTRANFLGFPLASWRWSQKLKNRDLMSKGTGIL